MPISRSPRKRGRHAVACLPCHRRKQKCDGDGSTVCSNCRRRGVSSTCKYPGATEAAGNSSSGSTHVDAGAPDSYTASSAVELPEGEGSVGNLFRSQDAPSFFGSSYFGPQAAAKVIEAPAPDVSSGIRAQPGAGSAHSFRDEGGPFSQIWDLLGILPRRKATVDNLTECFLRELNWSIDAVHPANFREKYEAFWTRKFGFDDFATVDLRWLALLFIVLAYGVLLDGSAPTNLESQRELTETSLRFYWASRRAIVIAPSFYGESTDLVRAGILVTRYLIYTRRVTESWLTTSFAMRMSQAQGMHIDGERWRLPRKETETRRRLWSHLYVLDKTIALALGRPFAIVDQQCMVKRASNVWLDDLSDEDAGAATEAPISEPTQAVCNLLAHELAVIVGKIQEHCFGLFAVSLQDADTSSDASRPYLYWNRLRLHAMYHFARITLHRPYLLRHSITNRYRYSHDVCMSSACSDLALRLKYFGQPLQDRLKWALGPHHLFNGVLVLGVIAVQDPHSPRTNALLEDLDAYCEMQRHDVWVNEFALAEVKIVELCISKARSLRQSNKRSIPNSRASMEPTMTSAPASSGMDPNIQTPFPGLDLAPEQNLNDRFFPPFPIDPSANFWHDPALTLPEAIDVQQWEYVLDSIAQEPGFS
ncbi:hypothetical protein M409DRAFT_62234 [Zasmidium cellare ATCC 36951]|uniref:Zn(2)-C6 fungal-type domain-containing protein n=1 Tax=Zasmidium cellare ATCC 36951 TaxID=1080233 RepID=A0A6A6D4T2_ZASCE|nr:uncharacterized protein M409DRAFT_62234 [Zasmidium cellare ATCC 36951]KAF2174075.1 hypothetical protein M409DRAFT_62234 [Zasmidium cellare ATCC 36951]